MASSHSSSPVPQGSSSDVFFKKEVDPTKHVRPVQSLPDVCPKEPTGNPCLRTVLMICVTESVVRLHVLTSKEYILQRLEKKQKPQNKMCGHLGNQNMVFTHFR